MGTITTGVGLFSGLDYVSLVDQLIAIDAAPRNQLMVRMSNIDAQRTALLDITARVTALLSWVENLSKPSFFQSTVASSSNTDVLSATTGVGALPGSYSFIVRSLASTHQLISRGFATRDAPVAPGSFTVESAQARVNRQTTLDELNGFTGVQRASFKIVDGQGDEAVININDAQTVGDVIDRINAAEIGIQAELRGEAIVLKDTTGGTQGVRVHEVDGSHTAADLGFGAGHTYDAGGEIEGANVFYLAGTTPLSALNDGLGVRRAVAGADFTIQSSDAAVSVKVKLSEIITDTTRLERLNHAFGVELGTIRITTKDSDTTEIDLSAAATIGDVKQIIEDAVEDVSVVLAGGRLVITDNTGASESNFAIQDVEGHAARDLGILDETEGAKIDGRQILHVNTLADVIAAINYGEGNQTVGGAPVIEASIDSSGTRLVITDHGQGTFQATVLAVGEDTDSQALFDLGFEPDIYYDGEIVGKRVLGGIDTVLLKTLNGGNGVQGGTIHIAANGAAADVDLQDAETLREVIEQINAAAAQFELGIEAGYDATGTRLLLKNVIDDTGLITVSDVTGDFAESVGIAGSASRIRGDNLQRQYISELTRLEDLNAGRGVALGKLRITDSNSRVGIVDLVAEGAETLQDVIDAINALEGVDVEARINDTGDGLLIVDTAGGEGELTIAEDGATTARDLNILGSAADGQIDGSYEFEIELTGGETLDDLVTRINATTLATASVINDGSPTAPYRLNVASLATGRGGELIIDAESTDLDFMTMSRAEDAAVLLGSTDTGGLLLTSSSNTLTDVLDGLTLHLTSVDDQPVTVTVDRDLDEMASTLSGLANDYNALMDRIDELGSYDADTETKGILFADPALRTLESRLYRAFTGAVPGATGPLRRLSQVGVTFGSGARLTFDEEKFREVYEADPEEVTRFFTAAETGLGVQLKDELGRITESGGLLKRRENNLEDQREMLSDRVDLLNELLDRKRERLLREFRMMEQSLAQLQSQQMALSNMTSLFSFGGSTTGLFGLGG